METDAEQSSCTGVTLARVMVQGAIPWSAVARLVGASTAAVGRRSGVKRKYAPAGFHVRGNCMQHASRRGLLKEGRC